MYKQIREGEHCQEEKYGIGTHYIFDLAERKECCREVICSRGMFVQEENVILIRILSVYVCISFQASCRRGLMNASTVNKNALTCMP